MNKADGAEWRRTSPLSVLFFLGRILQSVAKNAFQVLTPVFAFLVAFGGDWRSKLAVAAVFLVVATIVSALLRYWFFRFCITDDGVRIREGVVTKKQVDIQFDRIQGINTEQNPVYRLLDLVTVSFDTAGSAGSEARLPAVPRKLADALQSRVGSARTAPDAQAAEARPAADELLRLDNRDMVRIGLADRRALVLLALAGPAIEQLGDNGWQLVANFAERAVERFGGLDVTNGLLFAVGLILAVVVVFALFSIVAAFWRYHDFRLIHDAGKLRTIGGLVTRHETSMDIGKLQVLKLRQGLVLRMFRRLAIQARQATSGGRGAASRSLAIPIANWGFAGDFSRLVFQPDSRDLAMHPKDERFRRISKRYLPPRILVVAVLPALLATALALPGNGAQGLLYLAWLPVGCLLVYRYWRCFGYMRDDDGFVRRAGLLGYRLDAFLFRKVQRVTLRQSWFQRRANIASLSIYLASGHLRIPCIDFAAACELQDYMLFKAESTRRAWH